MPCRASATRHRAHGSPSDAPLGCHTTQRRRKGGRGRMTAGAGQTLSDLGEFGLIDELTRRFEQSSAVVVGPGDDAAAIETGAVRSRRSTCSSKTAISGSTGRRRPTSDTRPRRRTSPTSTRWAAAPRRSSSGSAPPPRSRRRGCSTWPTRWRQRRRRSAPASSAAISPSPSASRSRSPCSGQCPSGLVRRSGARPGDVVAHAGRQGWADAGFAVLARGFKSPRAVVDAHRTAVAAVRSRAPRQRGSARRR